MANKIFVKTVEDKIYELDLDKKQDQKFYYHYKNNPFLEDYEESGRIIAEANTKEELENKGGKIR